MWVPLSADECASNGMHLKMISKSHKRQNNTPHKNVRYFRIVFSMALIIISCETIEEYNLLFEQFTVRIGVSADVWLWSCFALLYNSFFRRESFFALCSVDYYVLIDL